MYILGAAFLGIGFISLRWSGKAIKEEIEEKYENQRIELEKFKIQTELLMSIKDDIKTSIDSLVNEIKKHRQE